ncbi:putative transporter [Hyphodiscus hymeniophilus]|uniref:Transporter n=1 Tax=Hyphodiscus hymeniophilus TaxID=353542 RepID=A0A9P6VI46_9HELO|nr:putative transporter [Hyphodiscus hymeniophilus]
MSSLHNVQDEKDLQDSVHLEERDDNESALTPDQVDFKNAEARVLRKLDLFITPVMLMLQLISYLDRGNIGFAATQGMSKDIGLKGNQLNIAVSIFYLFYILAEFPTTLFVKRVQFHIAIPVLAACWGIICLCTGFIQNFAGLVVCRLMLGIFEGCLFPSMTLLLLNWYKREEVATRISFLYIGSALSGAFGGLIAFGILYMNGVAGYEGWRWLYIIEGLLTIVFSVGCYCAIPSSYNTAYFLTTEDKAIMKRRAEQMEAYSGGTGKYTRKDMKNAAVDMKTWLHGFIQIFCSTMIYGFGTFLPVIIHSGFHYSTKQAQYLVIPVNIVGAICYGTGAILADKYKARFISIIVMAPLGVIGYAILLSPQKPAIWYFATYLVSASCYIITGTNIAWHGMNTAPDGKRAAAMGIHLGLANIGGIIAGQIYKTTSAPRYLLGHGWTLASIGTAFIGWWVLYFIYKRREAEKDRMIAEHTVVPAEEWTDRAPDFRYQF